ncbi:MAG: hypothetical protein COY42_19245, partial [Armatimonadetes bacterium CG_4_10_14_0_8_um_filter_66_14]
TTLAQAIRNRCQRPPGPNGTRRPKPKDTRPVLVPEWAYHLRLRWRTGDVLMVLATLLVLAAVGVLFWSQIAVIIHGGSFGGGASGPPPAAGGPVTP